MTTSILPLHARALAVLALLGIAGGACAASQSPAESAVHTNALPVLDSARLMADLARLAHDSMAGRASMTPENAKAREWLASEVRRLGLEPVAGEYVHPFVSARRNRPDSVRGANVLALLRGTRSPERIIVVSAHYDHVGVRNGEIFNGADDNASGTAAVLALAAHFAEPSQRPVHSILFAFFDAEELGLLGARAFVANPPVALAAIGANVNMDMVSRSDSGELYAAGAARYPQLLPFLEPLIALSPVKLRLGHDSGSGRDDWTNLSDQGAFHAVGIPFVLFSVEDHADYHQATDDVERIHPGFYYGSVRTIAAFVRRLDAALPAR